MSKQKPISGKTKTAKKKENPAEALASELKKLIPRLDAEGLQFLIEQAQIHLYNMQVDELNQTMEKSRSAKAAAAGKKKTKISDEPLRIEGSSGSSFYLYCNGESVMFTRNEILHLVNIVNAPAAKPEIQEHLLNWFKAERRDIFSVLPIADKFDKRLTEMAALLKKNFSVRKQ